MKKQFKKYIETHLVNKTLEKSRTLAKLESRISEKAEIIRTMNAKSENYYIVGIRYYEEMEKVLFPSVDEILAIGRLDIFEPLFNFLEQNKLTIEARVDPTYVRGLVVDKDKIYGKIKNKEITNLEAVYYMNAFLLSEDIKYQYGKGSKLFIESFRRLYK